MQNIEKSEPSQAELSALLFEFKSQIDPQQNQYPPQLPPSNRLWAISCEWWNQFMKYCGSGGTTALVFCVDNFSLVNLDKHYEAVKKEMFPWKTEDDHYKDWTHMSLKSGLEVGKHFFLIDGEKMAKLW